MLRASQALRFARENQSGILVVVGGFLLNVCFSLDYSYANLNSYVTSYMRQNGHNPNMEYKDFIFLTAGKRMTQGVFAIFGGMLSQRLGARLAILVGCIILITGYSVTFFALESNFFLVVLSVGFCHGVGFCLVYATAVGVAQHWFPAQIRGCDNFCRRENLELLLIRSCVQPGDKWVWVWLLDLDSNGDSFCQSGQC